jgi:hypothetical protein
MHTWTAMTRAAGRWGSSIAAEAITNQSVVYHLQLSHTIGT